MALRADIELEAGAKTFATGLLMELIVALRSMRPGDLMAVMSSNRMLGTEIEAWCRYTRNSLVEVSIEQDRHRWVIRCGEAPAETDREAPAEAPRALGSRLWLYTNFDCNLRCDYVACVHRRRHLDARLGRSGCGGSPTKHLRSVWARFLLPGASRFYLMTSVTF